jgi:hypothetical protein
LTTVVSVNSSRCVATTSLTSASLSSQAYSAIISAGLLGKKSGTTPLVIAETIFWRAGANGIMLSSILLPLAFS